MSDAIKSGIVGFFDILGYKNFIDKNDISEPIIQVLKKINSAGEDVISYLKDLTELFEKRELFREDIVNRIKWQNLSDSIIMYIFFEKDDMLSRHLDMLYFSVICSSLMRHMLDFGLPLRGAIDVGKFYFEKNCFAGKPIGNAYSIAQDLDLTACVFCEEAVKFINEKVEQDKPPKYPLPLITIEYPIPFKSKAEHRAKEQLTLNYIALTSEKYPPISGDIKQYILDSFWSHNKTINPQVESKIHNTEQYFRFIKYKFPDSFIAPPKSR